jgi:hypothetical protein
MRSAPGNCDKIPCAHDPHLITHTDLDLALDEVKEMMAARMRVTFNPVFETIDPNVHLGRLRQQGKLKPIVSLKGRVDFDLHNGEVQLSSDAVQWEEEPEGEPCQARPCRAVDQEGRIFWLQECPGTGKPSDEHSFSPTFSRL